jgi:hypothetical protein
MRGTTKQDTNPTRMKATPAPSGMLSRFANLQQGDPRSGNPLTRAGGVPINGGGSDQGGIPHRADRIRIGFNGQ